MHARSTYVVPANAGTHTPYSLVWRAAAIPSAPMKIGGYGSRLALRLAGTTGKLLTVIGQDLRAGPAQPAAVLLQARQHELVAVIDVGAAKPRDVARASVMPLLRRSR